MISMNLKLEFPVLLQPTLMYTHTLGWAGYVQFLNLPFHKQEQEHLLDGNPINILIRSLNSQ